MQPRSLLAITVISAALAGYILFMREADEDLSDIPAPAQPGYYLRDATLTETDASGNARMRLHATQIAQDPNDNSINLQQVSVTYHSDDARVWLLTAHQGHLPAQSTAVQFTGDVLIRPGSAPTGADALSQIHAEALSIDPAQNTAHAPGAVRLELGPQQITAVGMNFDFTRQKLRLESNVHGQLR